MWKNRHFALYALLDPVSVLHPTKNGTTIQPRYLPTYNPWDTLKPCRSFIEKKLIFWRHHFWQITWTALESPKIDICQNWPRRVLGDIIRYLESKFDIKIPMGSVPNCWKEIPVCHAIRWFKCKLKPPKKWWRSQGGTPVNSVAFTHAYTEEHKELPLDVTLAVLYTLHINSAS